MGAPCQKNTVAQLLGLISLGYLPYQNQVINYFIAEIRGSFTISLALRILKLCRVRRSYGKVTRLGHKDVVLLE
jgi:hypothetical protein